jgi:hypothetical protein
LGEGKTNGPSHSYRILAGENVNVADDVFPSPVLPHGLLPENAHRMQVILVPDQGEGCPALPLAINAMRAEKDE